MRLLLKFLLPVLFFVSKTEAQLIYKGEYSVGPELRGEATFEYEESRDGTMIKSGKFLFNASASDSSGNRRFKEITWKGYYRQDEKHGEWRYHYLSHDLKVLKIEDFKPDYRLNTQQEFIRGVYDRGLPHGPWSLKIESISSHRTNSVISRAEATFKRAKLDKNFYFSEDENNVTISGRAENGLMVDAWRFKYDLNNQQIDEHRQYVRGFLTSLIKTSSNGDTLISLQYPLSDEIMAYLDSGQSNNVLNAPVSLHFSDGYPRNSDLILEQDQGNFYLNKLMKYLMRHDLDFAGKYGLPLGANRMYYPLSAEEKSLEENWVQVYYIYRNKIDHLLELSSQNGFFNQDDTIAFIDEWVKIQNDLIEYITPWDNIIMKKEIGYYNRKGMLKEYVVDLLATDTLTLDSLNIVKYPSYSGDEQSFLFFLDRNIKERTVLADSFLTIYERKKSAHREFEAFLATKRAVLNEQAEVQKSLKKMTGVESVDRVLMHLDNNIIDQLGDEFLISTSDSMLSATELKMNGKMLQEKFSIIRETEDYLRKVAKSKTMLEEMFTSYRFDPFTYSENVPYKKFPEVYSTYAEMMVENSLKEALNIRSVPDIYSSVHLALRIQERLAFLSDKEEILRSIEKRLNKRQSDTEKLELLKP